MENTLGMQSMGHEELENIFSYLNTEQLLQFRLTSQLWRSVASQLCRKRHVLLKPPKNSTETIHTTFLSVSNLPWSTCKIELPSQFGGIEDLPKCLQTFGHHIRAVHINMFHPCYAELRKIVICLPLLQFLRVSDSSISKHLTPIDSSLPKFSLSKENSEGSRVAKKLRKFGGRIFSEESFKFLEWILCASVPNMVGLYAETKYADLVLQILSAVRSVFLSMVVDSQGLRNLLVIPEQNLQNLKQLNLELGIDAWGHDEITQYLENVELFLSKIAPNLEHFSFGFRGTALVPKQIDLQKMPKLKLLKFTSCDDHVQIRPPLYILKPFTSDQFSSLHKVVLSSYYKNRTNIDLFKSCKFDTVRELVVFKQYSNPMEDDWATVFPNLESLFSTVRLRCLEYILQRMHGLVSLRLQIKDDRPSMNKSELDVNIILSGIPNVDDIYKLPKSIHSRAEGRSNSLHSLKNLKRLELSFPPHSCRSPHPSDDEYFHKFRLRDSGAYFSMLELEPLDYLGLRNAKISEALNKDLAGRHAVYEQLDNESYRRFRWHDGAISEAEFEFN